MNQVKVILRTIALTGWCVGALSAHAATLTVDCDAGGAIMSALAKAQPGDTVLVSGYCKEHVNIAPELVRITLDGQKKATIHHPGGTQASPHAIYNRGKEITIKGFTVTGGLDGIHLSGPASAVLDGNVVVKNSGRGIHIDKGSIARMLNNTVEDSGGIGISITGTSYAYIGVFIPRIPASPHFHPTPSATTAAPASTSNAVRAHGSWATSSAATRAAASRLTATRRPT